MGNIFLSENDKLQYYIGDRQITSISLGTGTLYESVQWGKVVFHYSTDGTQLKKIQITNGNFMELQKPHEIFTSSFLESLYSIWGPYQSGTAEILEGDTLLICVGQVWVSSMRQRFNSLYYVPLSSWESGNYGNSEKTAIYIGNTVANASGTPDLTSFTYLTPYVEMVYDL